MGINSTNSTKAKCTDLQMPFQYFLDATTYILIFIPRLLASSAVLWILCYFISKKNKTIIFMINLSVADLAHVLSLPFRIYYYIPTLAFPEGHLHAMLLPEGNEDNMFSMNIAPFDFGVITPLKDEDEFLIGDTLALLRIDCVIELAMGAPIQEHVEHVVEVHEGIIDSNNVFFAKIKAMVTRHAIQLNLFTQAFTIMSQVELTLCKKRQLTAPVRFLTTQDLAWAMLCSTNLPAQVAGSITAALALVDEGDVSPGHVLSNMMMLGHFPPQFQDHPLMVTALGSNLNQAANHSGACESHFVHNLVGGNAGLSSASGAKSKNIIYLARGKQHSLIKLATRRVVSGVCSQHLHLNSFPSTEVGPVFRPES
ncbi:putative P2Y purinoceptor 10 [Galemys pyrenaicus]|uniref:Putative P2Y purinoceptor 10 n=1 Tax=Galemys pyrenaicus TaxID=202257 RepID=A0A8J5ZYJ4_GALPY|nr:putative P2Y purinoceptor 10 [Galemys pyrenaicus]